MNTNQSKLIFSLAALAALCTASPVHADSNAELVGLINGWRAAPGSCDGQVLAPRPPLAANPALAQIGIASGADLKRQLEHAGYLPRHAEGVAVSGVTTPRAVLALLQQDYCRMVLDARFSAIGTARSGNDWQLVFAQPLARPDLRDWKEAGRAVLRAANAARASARSCGGRLFPAAPPMTWDATLGEAALGHSRDMARAANLSHTGSDGSTVGQRLTRMGYAWGLAGENIQVGVGSADEAVAGWVDSPGHCANLMNPTFTTMGAAYAVDRERRAGNIYWTQVLSTPRR